MAKARIARGALAAARRVGADLETGGLKTAGGGWNFAAPLAISRL